MAGMSVQMETSDRMSVSGENVFYFRGINEEDTVAISSCFRPSKKGQSDGLEIH